MVSYEKAGVSKERRSGGDGGGGADEIYCTTGVTRTEPAILYKAGVSVEGWR